MERTKFFKTGVASMSLLSTMALTSVLAHHGHVYAAQESTNDSIDELAKATAAVQQQQQLVDEKTNEKQVQEASLQQDTSDLAGTNKALEEVVAQLESASTKIETTDLAKIASGISGEYLTPDKQAILDRLNAIRKEAYELGYVSSYVPIKWSTDLEKMAMTRAAEATVTGGHTRLDGSRYNTMISENGVSHHGENLAWGTYMTANAAIDYWYQEKALYAAGDRSWSTVGHYRQIIDPTHTHTGLGIFVTDNPKNYNNITVAEAFTTDNKGTSETVLGTYGRTDQSTSTTSIDTAALKAKKQQLEATRNTLEERIANTKNALITINNELSDVIASYQTVKEQLAALQNAAASPETTETTTGQQPTGEEATTPPEAIASPETTETTTGQQLTGEEATTPPETLASPETTETTTGLQPSEEEAITTSDPMALPNEESELVTTVIPEMRLFNMQNSENEMTPLSEERIGEAEMREEESQQSAEEEESQSLSAPITPDTLLSSSTQEKDTDEANAHSILKQPLTTMTDTQTAVEKAEEEGTLLPNTGVSPEHYIAFGTAASAILSGLGLAIPIMKKK